MLLNIIDTNFDSTMNKKYVLCKIKLSELREEVKAEYRLKYNLTDFDRFNSHSNSFKENGEQKYSETEELKFLAGIESNFLVLQSSDSIQGNNTIKLNSFYLIDGFRRLFFSNSKVDELIYLKVYFEEFTDADYMKIFYLVNLWKKAQDIEHLFFDRGFRLFMFVRYDVELSMWESRDVNHLKVLKNYLMYSKCTFDFDELEISKRQMGLLTSKNFINDLKLIDEMITRRSWIVDEHKYTDDFIENFFFILGQCRRKGFKKDITFNEYLSFLDNNSKEVEHIKKMSWTYPHQERIQRLYKSILISLGAKDDDRKQ